MNRLRKFFLFLCDKKSNFSAGPCFHLTQLRVLGHWRSLLTVSFFGGNVKIRAKAHKFNPSKLQNHDSYSSDLVLLLSRNFQQQ